MCMSSPETRDRLVLQTALDDGLDHDAFVRTLASMLKAVVDGKGVDGKGCRPKG